MTKRKYRGTDTQMLLAASQIAEFGMMHEQRLSARRPQWKAPFFLSLKEKITQAHRTSIGVDILPSLMEATAEVKGIIATAHRGIMELKAEIKMGFRNSPTRRGILLTELGYDKLPKRYISQSKYVQLLATLRANLTPAVKAELVEVGANPAPIDALLQLAQQLIDANDRQESLKVTRKSRNAENIAKLNTLYDEVSTVCKLVSACFTDDKALAECFSFTKALKAHGYTPPARKKRAPASSTRHNAAAPGQEASSNGAPITPTSTADTPSAADTNEKVAAADK
jgi:hypothetical protein